jgi:hypothetical protein
MALATAQSNRPFLPPIPRQLPKTQAEWEQVANALQGWQASLSAPKWISPTLQNGWVYYGSPYEPPGYYMDVAGVVHLRGLIKSGTVGYSTPVFILPTPYIPSYTTINAQPSADLFGEVRILAANDSNGSPGAVVVSQGSNAWASLSGISFSTTP